MTMSKSINWIIPAIWITTIVCLWLPTPGLTLKCHICTSLYNESCAELKDDQYLTNCSSINEDMSRNHTNCRKEVFSTYSKEFRVHTERTVRSCGYEKHPKYACFSSSLGRDRTEKTVRSCRYEKHSKYACFYSSNIDLKSTTCECIEDGCNTGAELYPMINIMLVSITILILISF